ncbi:MAG TPA: hypothetical protein VK875_02655 [Euzebyales bacterium]|nr:hypothetical protein [Euzebyales bacterium]
MTSERPDFGPSGYLPPRAARRARKIMLREPMGLQWPVAAALSGVVVLIAGVVLVLMMSGPPGPPFVAAGDVSAVDPRGAAVVAVEPGLEVLVVRGGGGVTVLGAPDRHVAWCPASRRLEGSGGAVWEPSGRLIGGTGTSLPRLPAEVHDGIIYVDPTAEGVRRPAQPSRGATPAC